MISSLQPEMQIDFLRVHEESSLLAFPLGACEAVTLLNLFFHVEQHVFSLLLTSGCATRMRSSEGKAAARGNQRSSGRLWSLGIQDRNSGNRQPDLAWDVQTLPRTIPTTALAVCPCVHSQDTAWHGGAAAFLSQHRAVCLQPRVAEGPEACSCFSSELFCSKKARSLPVLPTALLVIVTTTRSNPAVISSKHLLPVVCFSFLLEYLGLTEP